MSLGMELRLGPGDFVLDGYPAPPSQKWGGAPPKFSAHDYCGQTAGWMKLVLGTEVDLSPGDFVLDGDPAPFPRTTIFGPFLLWPNGWMNQNATWCGGTPQPRGLCVRWRLSPPLQKGAELPNFSAHVYCGRTAGWIKMPLGTEVGLGPDDIVLDGDPAPPQPMCTVAKRLDGSRWYLARR